jgi:hypothetical protein
VNTSPHTPPPHPTLDQVLEQAHVALQQQSIGLGNAGLFADRRLVDQLASVLDNTRRIATGSTDSRYRCEKVAAVADAALSAQREAFEIHAVNGAAETLIDEAFAHVESLMRRTRTIGWALAAGGGPDRTAVADLEANLQSARRWCDSMKALAVDTTDGAA